MYLIFPRLPPFLTPIYEELEQQFPLEDGKYYKLGPTQPQQERAKRARDRRYTKGVEPRDALTLPVRHLALCILKLASEKELVLLKGPAAVGKSSLMNLAEYFCQNNK